MSLHFEPLYQRVTTKEVERVLRKEISQDKPRYLTGLLIESSSLEIRESGDLPSSTAPLSIEPDPSVTPASRPHQKCTKVDLSFCDTLPYNITMYPNLLGHKSSAEVQVRYLNKSFIYVVRYLPFEIKKK